VAWVRDTVVNDGFLIRDEGGPKNVIPEAWRTRVLQWGEEDLDDLLGTGAGLVGDMADLRYDPAAERHAPPTARDVSKASAVAILAVAKAFKDQLDLAPVARPRQRRLFRKSA
jgi:hypothetical protein